MADEKTTPTWIYKGDESKLVELKKGEKLPAGWSDAPVKKKAPKKEG